MADKNKVLCRFSTMPSKDQATALFVGVKGSGKHEVANALLKECFAEFRVQIRIATSLPLPPEASDQRPRIDFIVFFVDTSNKSSFDLVKSALQYVDIEYFLGHCCFVATNGFCVLNSQFDACASKFKSFFGIIEGRHPKLMDIRNESCHAISVEDVTRLAHTYDSPLFCAELQTERGQKILAKRLIKCLQVTGGFCSAVTPTLINATKQPIMIDDETMEYI